jgi:putative ABC transport system substrate-binding protein
MSRRRFIALAATAMGWPLVVRGQQRAPIIGFVGSDSPELYMERLRAFRLGLRVTGFKEGQDATIEYRWAEGRNDQLRALTADLVHRKANVIVTPTTPSALAAKAITDVIPIVFFVAGDPVQLGLVASLGHPGGNLTGATTLTLEVGAKRLELLHEMLPAAKVIAALINPTSPNLAEIQARDLQAAARVLGLQLHVLEASTDEEFGRAFARASELGVQGLVITSDSFFFSRGERLAVLAIDHKLPTIHGFRESAVAGGLMSYGGGLAESFRWLGHLSWPDTQGR